MIYLTEDLVSSVKRRAMIPSSQQTFQDSDLIALANEELELSLFPDLLSLREDLFLRAKTVALQASVSKYTVPERAGGSSIKKVFYLDPSGNRLSLSRRTIASLEDNWPSGPNPVCFILEGDQVRLLPVPQTATGTLEIWYSMRPNQLVPVTSCAKITAVSSAAGTTTFTVDTDLTASLSVGSLVDVLNAQAPFMLWGEDAVITGITSSSIAVASVDVDNEAGTVTPGVGDYVCPAQKACIPMVPQEFHPILSQMVSCRALEALGDVQKLQAANGKLTEMRRQAFQMAGNRVESDLLHVVKRNGILSHSGYGPGSY